MTTRNKNKKNHFKQVKEKEKLELSSSPSSSDEVSEFPVGKETMCTTMKSKTEKKCKKTVSLDSKVVGVIASSSSSKISQKKRQVDEKNEEQDPVSEDFHSRNNDRPSRRVATKKVKYTEIDTTTDEESASEDGEDIQEMPKNETIRHKSVAKKPVSSATQPFKDFKNVEKHKKQSMDKRTSNSTPHVGSIRSKMWQPHEEDWRASGGIDY